jgi:putative DNA primase/helicase
MDIVCTPVARRNFAEYLVSADVKTRITVTPRTGWIDANGTRLFALPDQIIGATGAERILFEGGDKGFYARRGALADWRDGDDGAGALARDHRLLRFSIATALAGPLLLIGGYEGAIVHIHHDSSQGKTICLRVAASVWGSGADGGYMRVWRTSVNGLEAALAASCDTLLVLDDTGQIDGKDLGAAIYMAMGGLGKQRMQRDATLKAAHTWRVMGLSSGETSIATKLTEHGGRAYAGHLVRAIDIKVSRSHGAFDALDPKVTPEAFADQVKHAAATFYGNAGPIFIHELIKHGVSERDVRALVDDFVGRVLKKSGTNYHGQAARVAQHFGLIAAAGELATRFNIVAWPEGAAPSDCEALFEDWLSERGGSVSHEARQAVSRVRHFLEAHGDSRFENLDAPQDSRYEDPEAPQVSRSGRGRPVINRAGYRKGEGDEQRWLVLPEVFVQEICAGLNPTSVARTLAQEKMLVPDAAGKFSRLEWVHGKPQRVYVLTPSVFEGWDENDSDSDPVVDLFP